MSRDTRHETTSGLLSFATYYLLKHPDALQKAQKEVDEKLQRESFQPKHLNQLPYLSAVLRETLRLSPTAPIWSVRTIDQAGEVIGGKYFIDAEDMVSLNLSSVHRDPAVYGETANEFRPERMLDQALKERPPNAFMPFGNGARACIGRHFAWQESLMSLAMTLQYFDLEMVNPSYALEVKQSVTQKPINFDMRLRLRKGISVATLEHRLAGSVDHVGSNRTVERSAASQGGPVKPMDILYGSNSGTCEAFARVLANDAAAHGFEASVATLDSAKDALHEDRPIAIVTASYEGEPCDNAKHFYNWLDKLPANKRVNVTFAVFGAGHSDWTSTFFKIPAAIDGKLAAHGASRLCSMGSANAANGNMMTDFQSWEDDVFCKNDGHCPVTVNGLPKSDADIVCLQGLLSRSKIQTPALSLHSRVFPLRCQTLAHPLCELMSTRLESLRLKDLRALGLLRSGT